MKELQQLKQYKKGLIIHHWDTDGLCSAALLLNFFNQLDSNLKIDLLTPTINNYFLKKSEYQAIVNANYDFIVTCDINFDEQVVTKLSDIKPGKVFIFDHHIQKPIAGVFYYNKPYPSCSLVLREYLQQEFSLLSILGAIGDKEEKIRQDEHYWPGIKKILEQNNLSFPQALQMRNLIDSCYMADDYSGISDTIKILQDDSLQVLEDENLQKNYTKIQQELSHIVEQEAAEEIDDKVFIFNIQSSFNIISHSTRGLARIYPRKIIMSWQYKNKQTNIYIRRRDLDVDLSPLIKWGRDMGFNAGGKQEVVGMIYNGEFSEIKDHIVNKLKQLI